MHTFKRSDNFTIITIEILVNKNESDNISVNFVGFVYIESYPIGLDLSLAHTFFCYYPG